MRDTGLERHVTSALASDLCDTIVRNGVATLALFDDENTTQHNRIFNMAVYPAVKKTVD